MALKDSSKLAVGVKYGGSVTSSNLVDVDSETRISFDTPTETVKKLNGKMGNSETIVNIEGTTGSVTISNTVRANDDTGLALDTLPECSDMYKACGLTETVDTATVGQETIIYTPSQSQPSDSEVAVWTDGSKRVLVGAVGDLSISGTIGERLKQSFAFSGFTTPSTTTEVQPSGEVGTTSPIVFKLIDTVTFTGVSYKAQSFEFKTSNSLSKIYAISTKQYDRTDFDATIDVTYFKENEDILTDFANGTKHSVNIKAGSVNGKSISLTAGQALVKNISEGTTEGKETITVTFSLQGDINGENQFALQYGYFA